MPPTHLALIANTLGQKYLSDGNFLEAERQFTLATESLPTWSVPWFNLGLVYKLQRNWPACLQCSQKAAQLSPDDTAAWWNLGIAATALHQWTTARQAWQACGIHLPPGKGELRIPLGSVPIRLDPEGRGEVVWCDRIDPARAIILSVPLPDSGYHYLDLLLHDGAPNGYRLHNGVQVPVFDELDRLEPSSYQTYTAVIEIAGEADFDALAELADEQDIGLENWSTLRRLCKDCSRGFPHRHDDSQPEPPSGQILIGLAAKPSQSPLDLLTTWSSADPTRRILLSLPPPPA